MLGPIFLLSGEDRLFGRKTVSSTPRGRYETSSKPSDFMVSRKPSSQTKMELKGVTFFGKALTTRFGLSTYQIAAGISMARNRSANVPSSSNPRWLMVRKKSGLCVAMVLMARPRISPHVSSFLPRTLTTECPRAFAARAISSVRK